MRRDDDYQSINQPVIYYTFINFLAIEFVTKLFRNTEYTGHIKAYLLVRTE
jgi:HKD family nuclease